MATTRVGWRFERTAGRRTPDANSDRSYTTIAGSVAGHWLALGCFGVWIAGAGIGVAWPFLEQAGMARDIRHLVVNVLNVTVFCFASLLVTTFGIRERLRPHLIQARLRPLIRCSGFAPNCRTEPCVCP